MSARWKRHSCTLPPEFTVELVRDMVCGLMHLHSMGVAHRELKMDNMMLQVGAGGRVRLKLCDYGWCKPMTYEASLATPAFAQCYRAPEIVLCKSYSELADVRAAGLVARELITGRLVWQDPLLSQVEVIKHVRGEPVPDSFADPAWVVFGSTGADTIGRLERLRPP